MSSFLACNAATLSSLVALSIVVHAQESLFSSRRLQIEPRRLTVKRHLVERVAWILLEVLVHSLVVLLEPMYTSRHCISLESYA